MLTSWRAFEIGHRVLNIAKERARVTDQGREVIRSGFILTRDAPALSGILTHDACMVRYVDLVARLSF